MTMSNGKPMHNYDRTLSPYGISSAPNRSQTKLGALLVNIVEYSGGGDQ